MELLIQNALNIGSDEFYRASRYKLPLVVILINTQNKKAFDILELNLRRTDLLQQLNSESIIVYLTHTNYDDALLFLKKIKDIFLFSYTLAEYRESEESFLEKLFIENEQKCPTI